MIRKHYILGMAGHIDHGKSALVEALTGVDPDRLPEEQVRGMTIDLGFAHLDLASGRHPETFYQVGVVDVPGHANFINNMVSGIGSIDLALLVVAADDGWMPQSEEHLQILQYLGVKRIVLAWTKSDLASPESDHRLDLLRKRLERSAYADAEIVPTSIVTGAGLDLLRSALSEVLDETPEPPDIGKPRLPIDRVFTRQGVGTIVTGTLTGGTFQCPQSVIVQPSGLPARIRNIQSHNRAMKSIGPGTRVALNLADVAIGGKGGRGIRRGDVVMLPALGGPTDTIDVLLTRIPHGESSPLAIRSTSMDASSEDFPRATRSHEPEVQHAILVQFHHGGTHVGAKIYLLDRQQLEVGESASAQIRLESPVLVFTGDRFLIRSWSKRETLSGGTVLEPHAVRRGYRDPSRVESLRACSAAFGDLQGQILDVLARHRVVQREELLRQSNFSDRQITGAIGALAKREKLIVAANYAIDATWWRTLEERAISMIDAQHEKNSHLPGLPLSDLRASLEPTLMGRSLFDAFLDALKNQEIVQLGSILQRKSHRPQLPDHLARTGQRIRDELEQAGLKPPLRKELAQDKKSIEAIRFLIEQGEFIELDAKVVLSADCYERARAKVRRFLMDNGSATTSQLRELLGTNRKVIIPLVEAFDREGLTVRNENLRMLVES
jgi:selenocysteine-specific elongation factor